MVERLIRSLPCKLLESEVKERSDNEDVVESRALHPSEMQGTLELAPVDDSDAAPGRRRARKGVELVP
jgi:hypothetical protein